MSLKSARHMSSLFVSAVIVQCCCAYVSYAQQLKDVSSEMSLSVGSYYIDTTGIVSIDDEAPDLLASLSYARRGFHLSIPISTDPSPTTTIQGDTVARNFIDTTSSAMLSLKTTLFTFGEFRIIFSDRNTNLGYTTWELEFDSLVKVLEIDTLLGKGDSIMPSAEFYAHPLRIPSGKVGMRAGVPANQLPFTNGGDFGGKKNDHSRGPQWANYSVNAPLGWDITTGKEDIIYVNPDLWQSNHTGLPTGATDSDHPDFLERTSLASSGNFRIINNTNSDGTLFSIPDLGYDHGLNVISMALASANPANVPSSASMTGICYSCNGSGIPIGDLGRIRFLDCDLTVDNNTITADVTNRSFTQGFAGQGTGVWNTNVIDRGIIFTHASGNGTGGANGVPGPTGLSNAGGASIFPYDPGNRNANPHLDYKPISVGGIQDGLFVDTNDCSDPTIDGVWSGEERFVTSYNYAEDGAVKFSLNTDFDVRQTVKAGAFMDLVAPAVNVFCAADEHPAHIPSGNWRVNVAWTAKYLQRGNGTSLAAPMVAGTAGLMRSVDKYLGVPLTNGVPTNGKDVHIKAYNILTFTATKLNDDGLTWNPSGPNPVVVQPNYVVQTDDRLQRSWAQRMGFGKLNVYRAVAHSITCKAAYEFNSSLTLDPCLSTTTHLARTNEFSQNLIHMGSYVNEGALAFELPNTRGPNPAANDGELKVIEWGGVSLPSEIHNNQGVTRITGAGTRDDITVPSNTVLAIDGILVSDHHLDEDRVFATATGSKILMEGLLQNVELIGNLHLGRVIVDGTSFAPSLWFSGTSEVYGRIDMLNDAWWTNAGGITTMFPGSSVHMQGTRDMRIMYGAELAFESGSEVHGAAPRKIIVNNLCTLRIKEGAKVNIDTEVEVLSGGVLIIEDTATVRIARLKVDSLGQFIVEPGAHVTFGNGNVTMNGIMQAVGLSNRRITFSADLNQHCFFDMSNHNYMGGRTRILAQGNTFPLNPLGLQASVRVEYANFKNVSLEMQNITKDPIRFCEFSAHTQNPVNGATNVWTTQPFMLSSFTTMTPAGMVPTGYDQLIVESSRFADSAGVSITYGPFPGNVYFPGYQRYIVSGINTSGHTLCDVSSSHFQALNIGILSTSATTDLEQNTFNDLDRGVIIIGGMTRMCQNETFTVETAVSVTGANTGRYFDNEFHSSRTAVTISNSLTQAFRGNQFIEYYRGIVVSNATAALTAVGLNATDPSRERFGRNTFNVSDPAMFVPPPSPPLPAPQIPSTHPNVFMRRENAGYTGDQLTHSDLWEELPGGVFQLACGRNLLSQFATNHIGRFAAPNSNINGTVNDWRPIAFPRVFNYAVNTPPFNVGNNEDDCEFRTDTDPCSQQFAWSTSRPYGKEPVEFDYDPTQGPDFINSSNVMFSKTMSVRNVEQLVRQSCGLITENLVAVDISDIMGNSIRVNGIGEWNLIETAPGIYTLRIEDDRARVCNVVVLITP